VLEGFPQNRTRMDNVLTGGTAERRCPLQDHDVADKREGQQHEENAYRNKEAL
jgi:hypothetical protein